MNREQIEERTGIFLRAFTKDEIVSSALARALIEFLVDAEGLSLVRLRHAGWVDLDDHSLHEIDTDTDWQPPGTAPVWQAGQTAVGLPSLLPLDAEE